MRMMMKMQMDTEAGSKAIADGTLPQVMGKTMEALKPEAAYFGPSDGQRTAFIIFDLEDPSQLPIDHRAHLQHDEGVDRDLSRDEP